MWEEVRLNPLVLFNPIENIGTRSRGREDAIALGLAPSEVSYYDLSQLILTPNEKTVWCDLFTKQSQPNRENLSIRQFVSRFENNYIII